MPTDSVSGYWLDLSQVFPTILASSSFILPNLFFGLCLLRYYWECELKPCFCVCVCVSEESLLSVWTEHLHFCSWNYTATGFSCCACLHSYAFEIMLGQKFLKVFLKHLFRNVCRSHMIICVTFHMHKLGSTCVSICWKWNCASPNLIF